jgi:hypothetical protein
MSIINGCDTIDSKPHQYCFICDSDLCNSSKIYSLAGILLLGLIVVCKILWFFQRGVSWQIKWIYEVHLKAVLLTLYCLVLLFETAQIAESFSILFEVTDGCILPIIVKGCSRTCCSCKLYRVINKKTNQECYPIFCFISPLNRTHLLATHSRFIGCLPLEKSTIN